MIPANACFSDDGFMDDEPILGVDDNGFDDCELVDYSLEAEAGLICFGS